MDKIPIGISSCLLGHPVRHDGGHKYHSYIEQTLGQYFRFRPFCPEMESGMGTPRPAIQLQETPRGVRAICVKDHNLDVTERLEAISVRQQDWLGDLCGYILKKDSPSCGMQRVKVYTDGIPFRKGAGIFADYLRQAFPNLPIEEEGRLGDAALRENFIQRVFVYYRWRQLCEQPLTPFALMRFHSRHKLIAMSHNQDTAHKLGRMVADCKSETLDNLSNDYFSMLMECLRVIATRKNHVNVLQHIQGYLKTKLDSDDKLELVEAIENYRLNRAPILVPLTLLRHHFRKQPNEFIVDSYYMYPHPSELNLLNDI